MNTRALAVVLLVVSCFSGCASAPKIAEAKYEQRFDFSTVKKYSLYNRNHEFSEYQSLSDAKRNDIELAIERSLERQGLLYSEVDAADVVMTYYLVGTSTKGLKKYNHGVNYCSYCLLHSKSGLRANRLALGAEHIILDAVSVKTKRSVWRSIYPLKVKPKDNSKEVQTKIHQAITKMLEHIKQPDWQKGGS